MIEISVDGLRQIMPLIGGKAGVFVAPLNAAMAEFEINTPRRAAAFLAQLAHESGEFRYMAELADGSAYDNRRDLGNLNPAAIDVARRNGTTAGRWFKGHGPMQITGYDNHLACGEYLGLDLVEHPMLLCEAATGCRGAGWFWAVYKNLNALADSDSEQNFVAITRRINGGTNGLADRQKYWARAKLVQWVVMPDFGDVQAGSSSTAT